MIPNKLHFIYNLVADSGGRPFGLIHYLAIKSAIIENKPDEVFFYYSHDISTEYFEKIRPYVTMVKITAPNSIFGNPLTHVAHQADIVRLLALKLYGGIYMDLDTICNKPFKKLLHSNSTVMGKQLLENGSFGVCNAVILAEKNSTFIDHWLETYQLFRSPGKARYWDEHSVKIPKQLTEIYQNEITIVPHYCFFFPTYTPDCLEQLFSECNTYDNAYCHHIWETVADDYITQLTESSIRNKDTTYNLLARKNLDKKIPACAEKSDTQGIEVSRELQKLIHHFETPTALSYLNQTFYSNDRKKIDRHDRIASILGGDSGLSRVSRLINKFFNK